VDFRGWVVKFCVCCRLMLVKTIGLNKQKVAISLRVDNILTVAGVNGRIQKRLLGRDIVFGSNSLFVYSKSSMRALVGILKNAIVGVSDGYYIELKCVGLGYRVIIFDGYLMLKLGFNHFVRCRFNNNLKIVGFKDRFLIYGLDLEHVMRVANLLRSLRVPDVYKGKGIQYADEVVSLKIGKKK